MERGIKVGSYHLAETIHTLGLKLRELELRRGHLLLFLASGQPIQKPDGSSGEISIAEALQECIRNLQEAEELFEKLTRLTVTKAVAEGADVRVTF